MLYSFQKYILWNERRNISTILCFSNGTIFLLESVTVVMMFWSFCIVSKMYISLLYMYQIIQHIYNTGRRQINPFLSWGLLNCSSFPTATKSSVETLRTAGPRLQDTPRSSYVNSLHLLVRYLTYCSISLSLSCIMFYYIFCLLPTSLLIIPEKDLKTNIPDNYIYCFLRQAGHST